MRRYINEIDKKILNIVYTQEELDEMKELAKAWRNIKNEKRNIEIKIKDNCGYVIRELEYAEINYNALGDEFYVSYKDDNPKTLFKRIKDFFKMI